MAKRGGKREGAGRPKGSVSQIKQRNDMVLSDQLRPLVPFANQQLKKLMKSKNESVQVRALEMFYDRVFGRPQQAHVHSGDENNPIKHTVELEYV